MNTQPPSQEENKKKRRVKNLVTLAILLGLVVLFYAISIIRMQPS